MLKVWAFSFLFDAVVSWALKAINQALPLPTLPDPQQQSTLAPCKKETLAPCKSGLPSASRLSSILYLLLLCVLALVGISAY